MIKAVFGLLMAAALAYAAWCLISLPFSKAKGWKAARLAISLVCVIPLALLFSFFGDREATSKGFIDLNDMMAADRAGIENAAEWAEKRDVVLAAEIKKKEDDAAAKKKEKEASANAGKKKDADCRNELSCWAEKAALSAGLHCSDQVERFAKYDFEWTDGMLEPKFSHYRWRDQKAGVVTYLGDKIKMQNGFGAWTHMTYECDMDPSTKAVSDVRVREGRL